MKDADYAETAVVAANMMQYGGSFVRALGAALLHADSDNMRRIRQAFPEYWEKYLHIGENRGDRDG